MMTEYILMKCDSCGLVYANGWVRCPICNSTVSLYKKLYEEIIVRSLNGRDIHITMEEI